jgi:hypothetical protein
MPFIALYVLYKHQQALPPEHRAPNCPDDEDYPIASRFDHHATALSVKQWFAGTFRQIPVAELQAVAHPGFPHAILQQQGYEQQRQQRQQQQEEGTFLGTILNDTDRLSSLPGCHIQEDTRDATLTEWTITLSIRPHTHT